MNTAKDGHARPTTICLLGGTGFLGRRLAARLSKAGWALRIPTRDPVLPADLLVLPGVELITVDIRQPENLAVLFRDCHAVVNLVGILNEDKARGDSFQSVHVELVKHALVAARSAGVRKFVQLSALGAQAHGAPSQYLRSKGAAEELIQACDEKLQWSILQPAFIFGPGDSFLNRFAALLAWIPVAFPLARANAQLAPTHVDDVAQAIQHCIDDPATNGKRYELCGPEVYSLREILIMVASALGLRRRIIGLPDFMGSLQAWIMEKLPGKLFTLDNYRSLGVPNLCAMDGFAALGVQARSLEFNLRQSLGMNPRD